MKLTGKQHDFAVAYVASGNATAAYRKIYSTKSMSDRAIGVEASRLINHPKISLKIKELKIPAIEEAQVSLAELIGGLRKAAAIAIQTESAAGLVAAYRELGRLSGFYPVKNHKHEVQAYVGFAERLALLRKQKS